MVDIARLAAPPFAPAETSTGNAAVTLPPHRSIASIAAFKDCLTPLQHALGLTLPPPGKQSRHNAVLYLWTGPEKFLAVADNEVPDFDITLAQTANGLAAITDQSDGRTILQITGPAARDALAKLLPIDLHPSSFPIDATAATLAGHIPIQIWRSLEGFELSCFRSYAETLYKALVEACNF